MRFVFCIPACDDVRCRRYSHHDFCILSFCMGSACPKYWFGYVSASVLSIHILTFAYPCLYRECSENRTIMPGTKIKRCMICFRKILRLCPDSYTCREPQVAVWHGEGTRLKGHKLFVRWIFVAVVMFIAAAGVWLVIQSGTLSRRIAVPEVHGKAQAAIKYPVKFRLESLYHEQSPQHISCAGLSAYMPEKCDQGKTSGGGAERSNRQPVCG